MKSCSLHRFVRVTKTLRPHQPGTLKLTRRYGDALVCMRYREDATGHQRCTTIELVVDEGPVQRRMRDRKIVEVKIPWNDLALRQRVQQLHARWEPKRQTWRMSMRTARSLGLGGLVVSEDLSIDCKVLQEEMDALAHIKAVMKGFFVPKTR